MTDAANAETQTQIAEPDRVPDWWKPKKRLVPKHRGQRFRPHGTDAVGVITKWGRSSVSFHYLHAPDVEHTLERHEFTERFAEMLPDVRKKLNVRPQRAGVRYVVPSADIVFANAGAAA